MLQNLRDYFPKWLVAFLLGLLGLLLVGGAFYSPSSVGSHASNAALVNINGIKIRRSQLEAGYESLKQQQAQMGIDFRTIPGIENELRSYVLKQLVISEVLKQRVYSNDYRIHPQDVLTSIQQIPALQVNHQFSPKRFAEVLAQTGYTKTTFLKEMTDSRLVSQLSEALMRSAFVLPKEIHQMLRLTHQQRDFSYLELKTQHFLDETSSLSKKELRDYYERFLTEFRVPEQVSVDYVLLSRQEIIEQLKAAGSKDKDQLEGKSTSAFRKGIDRLTQLNYAHPHALTDIATALHLEVQSTPLFSRQGGSLAITTHPEVISAAFSPEVLQGRNSSLLYLDSDRVMVLRLKQHKPLCLPSFEKVQEKVSERLRLKKAKEATQAYGETLIAQMKQDATASYSLPAHSQWHKVSRVKRDDKTIPAEVLSAAFDMPYHGKASKIQGIKISNGDYAIICLSKVRQGKLSQIEKSQYDLYQQQITQEIAQLEYIQYASANEKRAKIDYSFSFNM